MDPDKTARSRPHVHCQKVTLTFQQKTKAVTFSKVSYSVDRHIKSRSITYISLLITIAKSLDPDQDQ